MLVAEFSELVDVNAVFETHRNEVAKFCSKTRKFDHLRIELRRPGLRNLGQTGLQNLTDYLSKDSVLFATADEFR